MSEPKEKEISTKEVSAMIRIGSPRKVKQATLQAETFWPGKVGADISLNAQKYPHMKMLWVPGDGLILQWEDGSLYTIAPSNVKGMEHC